MPREDFDRASDQALLRQYVQQRSEAAFTKIMRRHYSLVYSTCKREVGDADLAADAAQVVFMLLARRASTLRGGTGLAGWLFQTACFASKNALRREQRRVQRERKGHEMLQHEQPGENHTPGGVWEAVEPHLHDVLTRLTPDDREAILLRFFEEYSLAEIGLRLEVSENTARMRVTRALDKMRRHLAREGVVITGVLLAALLTGRATATSPAVTPSGPTPDSGPHLFSQATARTHQILQGIVTAMWIKTSAAFVATALVAAAVAVPLIAGPTAPTGQKASPAPATAGATTPSPAVQITLSVDYVTTSLANFAKESYLIAPGKEHDALLLAALLKDGAQDIQSPQLTTAAGVKGDVSIVTQTVPPLTSSIQATPRINKDGSITVALMLRDDTPSSKIAPGATTPSVTTRSVTMTGTFTDGQMLLIEYGGGSSDPSDPDHQANNSTASASLIFAKVKSAPSFAGAAHLVNRP